MSANKLLKPLSFLVFIHCYSIVVFAQREMPLYEGKIPHSIDAPDAETQVMEDGELCYYGVSRPTITAYLPAKTSATGAGVIICPGGGYYFLAFEHEGTAIAKALQKKGMAAFVLKYRLPDSATMQHPRFAPLEDAQRAIQLIRQRSRTWNINNNRVGIMGFSAGGHLAGMMATTFNNTLIDNPDSINLRPDFVAMAYAVTDLRTPNYRRTKSSARTRMFGSDSSDATIHSFSPNELVTPSTPPTFLVHAGDDNITNVRYTLDMYKALQQNKVETMMLIYPKGSHGFGVKNKTSTVDWLNIFCNWLKDVQHKNAD